MSNVVFAVVAITAAVLEFFNVLWCLITYTGLFTRITGKLISHKGYEMILIMSCQAAATLVMVTVVAVPNVLAWPSPELCSISYRVTSCFYMTASFFLYLFLFAKCLSVNVEHSISSHWTDKLMKLILGIGMPSLLVIVIVFANGVLIDIPATATDGSVGQYCAYTVAPFTDVYWLEIGSDFCLTALFTFMFVRPLYETNLATRHMGSPRKDILEKVLKEGIVTGVLTVLMNFIAMLCLAMSDFIPGQYSISVLTSIPSITQVLNTYVMFYIMRNIWLKPAVDRKKTQAVSSTMPSFRNQSVQGQESEAGRV
jgi:hypothetical protein